MDTDIQSNEDLSVSIAGLMDIIHSGNDLMIRHASERYDTLKKVLSSINLNSPLGVEVLKLVMSELVNLQSEFKGNQLQHEIVSVFSSNFQGTDVEDVFEKFPHLFERLETGVAMEEALAEEVLRQEQNIQNRDELISILEEDIALMEVEVERTITEVQSLHFQGDAFERQIDELERLFIKDPRYRVVALISKYPKGLTFSQLSNRLNLKLTHCMNVVISLEKQNLLIREGNLVKPILGENERKIRRKLIVNY